MRDQLIGRESRDLDLVVAGRARRAARGVANGLGADYYDLDRERDAGRVLVAVGPGQHLTLDFTHLDSEGIEADLKKRDFTVNSLAIRLHDPGAVLDVTMGMRDLDEGVLRACAPTAIDDDPIRALRAVRLAHQLGFDIELETLNQIQRAAGRLRDMSPERVRDEVFRILALPPAGDALRQSIRLGLLFEVLPELASLQGMDQPAPHQFDGLEHSLRVADQLAHWVGDKGSSDDLWSQLEPYSSRIQAHLGQNVALDRTRAQSLVLAGLVHDIGKPLVAQVSEAGVPSFHGHEAVGAEMAVRRGDALHLSRSEVNSLERVVANHMRPGQLAREPSLTGRAVYRFFRATGEEGVDICLLALADLMGQSEPPPDSARWGGRLGVVRRLLEAFFDRPTQEVEPSMLLSGEELMRELNLEEGPIVGRLLEAIRQEQAEGTIHSREQALAFALQQQRESEDSEA